MWLITAVGFFSVVRKPGDAELTVRARVREDLEALKVGYLPSLGPITSGEGTDYPYRARCNPADVARVMACMVEDITYSNFKDSVASIQGRERAQIYGEVWSTLSGLSQSRAGMKKTWAFGGVVVDDQERFLIRRAAGGFGGDTWTFPKGQPLEGETPKVTARRETEEETGVEVEIIRRIPGVYQGSTTLNRYFLMRPSGRSHPTDKETSEVCWVTAEEAWERFGTSGNAERDRMVLAAARELRSTV